MTGEKLEFRGDFYTHTLMTPFFTPDKGDLGDFGPPKIYLAGVGELMTQVAGEVCDGFIAHGFTTCLLYTSPSPRDVEESRMPSSA